ncbi:MAG TPA: class I SAM-dependent methyltransferase [Egibacteraceae bacterium]|nr:class I SAM-dependent methyltransferase [Egibacteraceae bacterium]
MDPRIADTVAAYDEAAEAYQEQMSERRPLDAVRKFAGLAGRGARILDVACGPVLDVRVLRDAGLVVVAGDRSQESMRIGKVLFPKGSLARWDFRRLPFADDTFEGVWAHAALQHLPRAQMRAGLAELRRVQRSGPIFLSFRDGSGDLDPVEDSPAGTVYITSVSADELKALLLDAGYVEVEIDTRPDLSGRPVTWLYGFGRLPQ